MQFSTYAPPPPPSEGDSYKPSDHVGRPLIVKVNEHKHIEKTAFKPDGGPGVVVSLVDLSDGEVYRDVLWMNGAIVDGLKNYAGAAPVVVKFGTGTSNAGRQYIKVDPATPDEIKLAEQFVATKGDPFAPTLGTVAAPVAAGGDEPPPWARG